MDQANCINNVDGYEMVNHPEHYNKPGKPECIDLFISVNRWVAALWCLETAYKYRYRSGNKPGEAADRDNEKQDNYFKMARKIAETYGFTEELNMFDRKLAAKFKEFGL